MMSSFSSKLISIRRQIKDQMIVNWYLTIVWSSRHRNRQKYSENLKYRVLRRFYAEP